MIQEKSGQRVPAERDVEECGELSPLLEIGEEAYIYNKVLGLIAIAIAIVVLGGSLHSYRRGCSVKQLLDLGLFASFQASLVSPQFERDMSGKRRR